jgi:arylsulfatase A-like enzyme
MMKTKNVLLFVFASIVCCNLLHAQKTSRPNIILILADDMGYSDLGCYGGEIATPNLDKLASGGLRYSQFYNVPHCCPSRASLMTGLYPHQAGLGWMVDTKFEEPGYTDELNKNCVTIAQVLKDAGYSTYMSGKWHLAHDMKANGPKYNWPLQRGFDKFYGIITGAGSFYDPATLCRDNTLITPYNDPVYKRKDFYFTDAISDNAVQFVQQGKKDKPFFMYLAYTAAHWPMQAPDADIAKYKGKYSAGWDVMRQERLKKEKQLGLINQNADLSPLETLPWAEETDKPAMERRMETYAAMITIMDEGIGRLVSELKRQGTYENTIILFLQDNGGNAEAVGFGGPNGETKPVAKDTANVKFLGKDDIQYAVVNPTTRDGKLVMTGKNVMAGPADTYLAYLKPWANLSNTPFTKYKNFVHEGGVATPLIVHWPAGIKNKGEIRKQVGHEIDIMPTLLDVAKAHYPKNYNGDSITATAGVSLVSTFSNKPLAEREIYWEHQANRAMRMGKWKIISPAVMNGPYGKWKTYTSLPWQLYDMENDRSETKDLSAKYPELVKKMVGMWEPWAHKTNVYPMPWKEEKKPVIADYLSTPWEHANF